MKAETKQDFEKHWKNHIQTLKRLGFSLEDAEDRERLQELTEELEDLTEKAAEDWAGDKQ